MTTIVALLGCFTLSILCVVLVQRRRRQVEAQGQLGAEAIERSKQGRFKSNVWLASKSKRPSRVHAYEHDDDDEAAEPPEEPDGYRTPRAAAPAADAEEAAGEPPDVEPATPTVVSSSDADLVLTPLKEWVVERGAGVNASWRSELYEPCTCSTCSHTISPLARFCESCGTTQQLVEPAIEPVGGSPSASSLKELMNEDPPASRKPCYGCGHILSRHARFCEACGAPQEQASPSKPPRKMQMLPPPSASRTPPHLTVFGGPLD